MRLLVESYEGDKISTPSFSWEGNRYKATSWYRGLRWKYTPNSITHFIIKDATGRVLERVEHELPE